VEAEGLLEYAGALEVSNRTIVEALTGGPLLLEVTKAGERVFQTGPYSHVCLAVTVTELDFGLLVLRLAHQVRSRIEGKWDRWQPGDPIWKPATLPHKLAKGETVAVVLHKHPEVVGVPPALRVAWDLGEATRAKFSLTLFGVDG
jgi:hypothetical protein